MSANHIIITGTSGSGKSSLAKDLSQKLGLPIAATDDNPDFKAAIKNNKIVDGNFKFNTQDQIIAARKLLKLDTSHILEGSGFLHLDKEELDPHVLHLVNPEKDVVIKQRINRWLESQKAKGNTPTEDQIALKNRIGEALYASDKEAIKKMTSLSEDRVRNTLNSIKGMLDKHNLEYFVVAGHPTARVGASIYNGKGINGAAKNARLAHEKWERKNGIDSKHDWSK